MKFGVWSSDHISFDDTVSFLCIQKKASGLLAALLNRPVRQESMPKSRVSGFFKARNYPKKVSLVFSEVQIPILGKPVSPSLVKHTLVIDVPRLNWN